MSYIPNLTANSLNTYLVNIHNCRILKLHHLKLSVTTLVTPNQETEVYEIVIKTECLLYTRFNSKFLTYINLFNS